MLNELATTPFDSTRTYDEVVHFVHIYVIEPHPTAPDPSPYSGEIWEAANYKRPQPRTYDARVGLARETRDLLEGDQLLPVDELTPEARNNPLWCSYGPAPNSAYLIGQDGLLHTVQFWVDASTMRAAIDRLLGG